MKERKDKGRKKLKKRQNNIKEEKNRKQQKVKHYTNIYIYIYLII